MDQKIKLEVPLVLMGKAPAVKELGGILVHELSSLDVERLPANMPHSIELDISGLVQLDQALHVKDLRIPDGVTVLTEAEKVVAKIARARIEVVEVVAPVEAEAEVAAEGEEGEEAEKAAGKAPEETGKKKPGADKKPAA